jgi:mono/diheme cytochrome c family protein
MAAPDSPPNPEPEPEPEPDSDQQSIMRGMNIYAAQCQQCHGSNGQGGSAPNLINSSFNTFAALRSKISNTMPRGNPGACTDSGSSTCATDAANYILNMFQGGN